MTLKILTYILEDDELFLEIIETLIRDAGIEDYKLFKSPVKFFEEFTESVHVCVVDFRLPGPVNGLEVAERVLSLNERCKIIVISGLESFNVVIDFLNVGAFKYIRKSDTQFNEKLLKYVQQALLSVKREITFYNSLKEKINPDSREPKKLT